MKPSEVLISAKTLIDSPEKWTQEEYARDANGRGVLPVEDAVCFCSIGAIIRTAHDLSLNPMDRYNAVDRLTQTVGDEPTDYQSMTIAEFNDNRSHAEVMRIWDKAIALAKQDEEVNHVNDNC